MNIQGCRRTRVGGVRSNHLIPTVLFFIYVFGLSAGSFAGDRKYATAATKPSLPRAPSSRWQVPTGTTSAATAAWTSGLLIPLDGSFSVVPFSGYSPPLYRNDDGSSAAIALPFSFCFYGANYTSVYINNNGTVSFGGPYSDYTPTGFPTTGYGMIAPFWADVDTRGPLSGVVYYRSEPHRFVVIWDQVGFYSGHDDKLNTFEVILTDGTDPLIGIGENIGFSYADMQWTTGDASGGVDGFGGAPATVGANQGNGVDYTLFGRFDHEGIDYDGPAGSNDGVSYLDGKVFAFDICLGTGMISGTVFDDANSNGVHDPGEVGLPGRMMVLEPGGRATLTEPDGDFAFSFLDPNVYTLQLVPRGGWIQTLPPSGAATINLLAGQTVNDVDFGVWAFRTASNLHISVEGSRARTGFEKTFSVEYRNNGTSTVAATVTLLLPTQVEYVASTDGGLYVEAMHTVVWDVGELPPDGFGRRKVTALIPATVPLWTLLYSTAWIDPTFGDINPDDNLSCEVQLVRSGFDPNDKEVRPGATIDRSDTLRYKINFQNVGNDTAFNITIRDTLAANLDIATLLPRASSHDCEFGITGSRELFWTFTNICLPDSTENETASHGFVAFEVLPVAALPLGTVFSNQAAIYFDFNEPVLTNVVTSQLLEDVPLDLVAHLTFDEGSGDIAHDASGHGNDGTLMGGATWAPGIFGNALSCDGIDDYARIPDSESLDIDGTGITFCAWVRSSGFQDYGWIVGKGYRSPWEDMAWWLLPRSSGAVRYAIRSNDTTVEQIDIPVGLATDRWEHVAVTYDGSYMRFYLNGIVRDSTEKYGNMNINDDPVFIGLDGFNNSNHFQGLIDEVKIFNRALTKAEIASEAERLVGHWTFDEGCGPTAYDQSGRGNDGTLMNSPTWTTGHIGGALEFDGLDDFVEIPDSESLDIDGSGIAFCAWVLWSPGFESYGWVVGKGYRTPWEDMVWWLITRPSGAVRYAIRSNNTTLERMDIPVGLTTEHWQHVAVVYDGSYMRFYLDGVVRDSAEKYGNMSINDDPVYIGLNGFDDNHYRGRIDDVRLYAGPLTTGVVREITELCGDLNRDRIRNVLDVVLVIDHAFRGGTPPDPFWCGDLNDDGVINVLDVVELVNHVFRGAAVPDCQS